MCRFCPPPHRNGRGRHPAVQFPCPAEVHWLPLHNLRMAEPPAPGRAPEICFFFVFSTSKGSATTCHPRQVMENVAHCQHMTCRCGRVEADAIKGKGPRLLKRLLLVQKYACKCTSRPGARSMLGILALHRSLPRVRVHAPPLSPLAVRSGSLLRQEGGGRSMILGSSPVET